MRSSRSRLGKKAIWPQQIHHPGKFYGQNFKLFKYLLAVEVASDDKRQLADSSRQVKANQCDEEDVERGSQVLVDIEDTKKDRVEKNATNKQHETVATHHFEFIAFDGRCQIEQGCSI